MLHASSPRGHPFVKRIMHYRKTFILFSLFSLEPVIGVFPLALVPQQKKNKEKQMLCPEYEEERLWTSLILGYLSCLNRPPFCYQNFRR